jgi:hypothetical protein
MIKLDEYNAIREYLSNNPIDTSYEAFVAQYKPKREKKVVEVGDVLQTHWNMLWRYWPSNNGFSWKGRTFEPTRNMRGGTEAVCKEVWVKIVIVEKKITPDRILHAAKAMFTNKMEESALKGKNELQYINALLVWLRKEGWVGWEQVKIKEDRVEHKNQEMLSI